MSLFAVAGEQAVLPAAPQSPADALDATLAKVVKIFGSGGVHNLEGYGTGLLVSPNGHVVTVWSHLLDSGDVSVVLNDGRRFNAKFIKGDPARDLAVLKIEGDNLDLPCFDLKETVDASPGPRAGLPATCSKWRQGMPRVGSSRRHRGPAPCFCGAGHSGQHMKARFILSTR